MPTGYLVSLGNNTLNSGDVISGGTVTFTTQTSLGAGQWTWSGTDGGTTYTNAVEPGNYYLATDGNIYFVPSFGPVTTLTSSTVTSSPSFTAIMGTSGGDSLNGTGVADTIYGGNSTSPTGTGNDTISAGAGNDVVFAGDGNDSIEGGAGADTIYGGAGSDTASYATSTSAVNVNLATGTASGGHATGDVLNSIENLTGSAFNDTLTGNAAANVISGGAGNDTISGGDGNDTLNGGDGADSVSGGLGNDSILGGIGNDTLNGDDGADTIAGGAGADTISGGAGNDQISGDDGADSLSGGTGSDTITGGIGNDTISGGDGADSLDGGADADLITGGTGNDTIAGGDGSDTIYGGTTVTGGSESLNWINQGVDGTNLSGGFTQDTGGMNVSVGFTNNGSNTAIETTSDAQYLTGSPYTAGSGLYLTGNGGPNVTTNLTFNPEAGSGLSDEVTGLTFRINDVDGGGWLDVITITALDADGNPVSVTITPLGDDTVAGNTITASGLGDSVTSVGGAVDVSIPGPLHSIQITYSNGGTSGQALWITDVHYTTVPADDGDDVIDGGAGDDLIYAGLGADTVAGGSGNDTIHLGAGDNVNDVIDVNDGDGNDLVYDFIAPTPNGDGTYTGYDRFDISDLTDSSGNTVKAWEVTVTDTNGDGTGDAILTFPNGESVTLVGVLPTQVDSIAELNAIGIPCFTRGTRIATPSGERLIEDLGAGDQVVTLDHGVQPIRWIGSRRVAAIGPLAPVLIPAGVLGNQRDIKVSQQHRMLLTGWQADLYFGEPEVLVAAKHLIGRAGIRPVTGGEVEYFHILFDRHEIILAEGSPSESFHPGQQGLAAFDHAARDEVLALFPDLTGINAGANWTMARRCLKAHEAAVISFAPPDEVAARKRA
ncbi:MAG: Hint domain-containing protein [Paracoccaceae bacterium]|nr:Hint domain-containing protein [Paracoccaceae bacterium]